MTEKCRRTVALFLFARSVLGEVRCTQATFQKQPLPSATLRLPFKIKSALRLSLAIGVIASTLTWCATWFGIVPNPAQAQYQNRIAIAKTLASSVTQHMDPTGRTSMQRLTDSVIHLNQEVKSVVVYRLNKVWANSGEDLQSSTDTDRSPDDVISLELIKGGKNWGELQIHYHPTQQLAWIPFPFNLVTFVFGATSLATWLILSRSFKYLNPSRVVPKRVRSAFDTLAEGLVLINQDREIAHANVAFEEIVSFPLTEIVGKKLSRFGWQYATADQEDSLPWDSCLDDGNSRVGQILEIENESQSRRFIVNTSPIFGEKGKCRGAMVSFDDITEMERQNAELRRSRDEVSRQNKKLTFLASYDPLTQCMNRRAFWSEYESLWKNCEMDKLSLVMFDIDHFKSINDTSGHSFGDVVLARIGETLHVVVGDRGVVCRYGGEEFAIAIPHADPAAAESISTEILEAVRKLDVEGRKITASLGMANRIHKAMDCQHLLDQADQCLYIAKNEGRDRLVVFDRTIAERALATENKDLRYEDSENNPHSAIRGILSALSLRCARTAEHSMRVAELAVRVGRQLPEGPSIGQLENAALLHDVGKIGLPDSILYKPGKLTESERDRMKQQDEVGMRIIRSAFEGDQVPHIIEAHRTTMNGHRDIGAVENETTLGGDIITACDALDSMLNEQQPWRSALSLAAAFHELVSNCPTQFNVKVVQAILVTVQKDGLPVKLMKQQKLEKRALWNLEAISTAVAAEEQLGKVSIEPAVREPADTIVLDFK